MIFKDHSNRVGNHAFLSPSNYSWINYDEDKLAHAVATSVAARRGSELHDLAQRMITLGVRLPDTQQTLNAYVNDAIGFRMKPEQVLYYSDNCYGTTDAIAYSRNFLRIHDLKTGITPCKFSQLEVYAALFCLEYGFKPMDLEIELRIYQNDDIQIMDGDTHSITAIMDKIVFFDRRINELREEVYR